MLPLLPLHKSFSTVFKIPAFKITAKIKSFLRKQKSHSVEEVAFQKLNYLL
jgi:hypothetical protein